MYSWLLWHVAKRSTSLPEGKTLQYGCLFLLGAWWFAWLFEGSRRGIPFLGLLQVLIFFGFFHIVIGLFAVSSEPLFFCEGPFGLQFVGLKAFCLACRCFGLSCR